MRCGLFSGAATESDTVLSLVRVHPAPHPDIGQPARIGHPARHHLSPEQVRPAQQPWFVVGETAVELDDLVGLLTGEVHAPLRAAQPKGGQGCADPERVTQQQAGRIRRLRDPVRVPALPSAPPPPARTPPQAATAPATHGGPPPAGSPRPGTPHITTTVRHADFVVSIAAAFQYISFYLPAYYIAHLSRAYELEQAPAAKDAIAQILTNSKMCAEGRRPLCQDPGIVTVSLKIGMDGRFPDFPGLVEVAVNAGTPAGCPSPAPPHRAPALASPPVPYPPFLCPLPLPSPFVSPGAGWPAVSCRTFAATAPLRICL